MTLRLPQDPTLDASLRPARPADLELLLPWLESAEQMRVWGGPALRFPSSAEALWAELGASPETTFILADPDGAVLGFGQVLLRDGAAHLARIIVSPRHRGRGLGRRLCQQLIQAALDRHHPSRITLNVYAHNAPARALYQSLGFEALPPEPGADPASVRMALGVG